MIEQGPGLPVAHRVIRDLRIRMTTTVLMRVIRVLHRYLWSGHWVQRVFNEAGLHVIPANFYSTVPTVDELLETFEGAGDSPPYLDLEVFDDASMLSFLAELVPFAAEFEAPIEPSGDLPSAEFHWSNSAFSYSDALAYYSIIRSRRPNRIIEIGSGYSTLVAAAALERNGHGEILCVDPFPPPFLQDIERVTEVFEKSAQSIEPDWFEDALEDGDILFIDSTHTVKIGSDCVHVYLRVLPAISKAILVHSHDIFLPYGFPPEWGLDRHLYWTEQYLVMAFLLQNSKYRVRYGSHYHHKLHPETLEQFMHGKFARGGSSLWYERHD